MNSLVYFSVLPFQEKYNYFNRVVAFSDEVLENRIGEKKFPVLIGKYKEQLVGFCKELGYEEYVLKD